MGLCVSVRVCVSQNTTFFSFPYTLQFSMWAGCGWTAKDNPLVGCASEVFRDDCALFLALRHSSYCYSIIFWVLQFHHFINLFYIINLIFFFKILFERVILNSRYNLALLVLESVDWICSLLIACHVLIKLCFRWTDQYRLRVAIVPVTLKNGLITLESQPMVIVDYRCEEKKGELRGENFRKSQAPPSKKQTVQPGNAVEDTAFKPWFEIVEF